MLYGALKLPVIPIALNSGLFWRRRGFLPSRDDPLMLFRSIADIAASLREAGLDGLV